MTARPFTVIGSSPNRKSYNELRSLLVNSVTIGLNRVKADEDFLFHPLDHWVVWDTHDLTDQADMVALTRIPCLGTAWFREDENRPGHLPNGFKPICRHALYRGAARDEAWYGADVKGRMSLPCRGSVCTTASALAYLMGATEIWLVGVDFATPGPTPDWTPEVLATTAKQVNEFYKDFPIPVYKTFDGGPLELEYREYGNPS